MILSNDGLVAFHYRSYGTFFLHKIGSIISIGDLPTTNIIEPNKPPAMRVRVEGYTKKLQTRYNKGVQANCKAKGEKYGTKGT